MTLRAANNRFGYYPPRTIDVYYDAIPITEQLVRTAVSKPKDAVLEIVRRVRNSSPDSDLCELLTVLETRIDSSFEAMVRTCTTRLSRRRTRLTRSGAPFRADMVRDRATVTMFWRCMPTSSMHTKPFSQMRRRRPGNAL